MRLDPIIPKKRVAPQVKPARVKGELRDFGVSVHSDLTNYPRQRAGTRYRRTGELGRRWVLRGPSKSVLTGGLEVVVGTNLKYAPYVEGRSKGKKPRQSKAAARAGWPAFDEVGQKRWKRSRPRILKALGL